MTKLTVLISAAFMLLLVACGGSSSGGDATAVPTGASTPSSSVDACAPARAHEAGEFDETIVSGGIERNYVLHVPSGYDGSRPVPLVFLLHGFALTGRIMLDYTHMGDIADREGFIVVAPNGTGDPQFWNARVTEGPDDIGFIDDMLDSFSADLCIDPARVYSTGYSNGGGMSMRLACDRPDRIRAVGLVGSVYVDCAPDVPVIAFHGVKDPLVPFDGGGENSPTEGGGLFPSVPEAVASWAEAIGCAPEPDVTPVSDDIEQTVYNGCNAGDGAAQLYVVQSGGHTWPGGDAAIGDPALTTQAISASELMWEFFSR